MELLLPDLVIETNKLIYENKPMTSNSVLEKKPMEFTLVVTSRVMEGGSDIYAP